MRHRGLEGNVCLERAMVSDPVLFPLPVPGEYLFMHTGEGPGPLCTQAASVVLSEAHLAACSAAGQASVLYKRFEEFLPPPYPHPMEERVGKKFLEDFDPSKGGYYWPLRQRELS